MTNTTTNTTNTINFTLNNTNTEIFNDEVFNTVSFNRMRKFKTELSRGVNNNQSFTNMVCNNIIGILTPWAGSCEVRGTFYATGEALNKFIRKTKQVLGIWNFDCVITIDNTKQYKIDNRIPGTMILCEAN